MAGIVKTTPAATESLADPVVCTMLFSRIEVRPRARKIVIDSTAIGMDELTVSPILSARYTLDALKISPSSTPRIRARAVSSGGDWVAGTYGWWTSGIGRGMWREKGDGGRRPASVCPPSPSHRSNVVANP